MGRKDPRVDAYIEKSAPFAKPILRRLRKLAHQGCPRVVEEIKWGVPHFSYGGMFSGMAAFKAHCLFVFWNRAVKTGENRKTLARLRRITALSDLPSDQTILGLVRQARDFADSGIKAGPVRRPKKPLPVPPALMAALKKKAGALAKFRAFSPTHQREYSEWIGGAKTDATRDKRIAVAVGWIGEGKSRHWKYQRPKKA